MPRPRRQCRHRVRHTGKNKHDGHRPPPRRARTRRTRPASAAHRSHRPGVTPTPAPPRQTTSTTAAAYTSEPSMALKRPGFQPYSLLNAVPGVRRSPVRARRVPIASRKQTTDEEADGRTESGHAAPAHPVTHRNTPMRAGESTPAEDVFAGHWVGVAAHHRAGSGGCDAFPGPGPGRALARAEPGASAGHGRGRGGAAARGRAGGLRSRPRPRRTAGCHRRA